MGQIRRRRRDIDPKVYEKLEELAIRTESSAPYIEAELLRQYPDRRIPSPSQIKRVIADVRPRDPTGPWTFLDCDPDDARLVLPVIAAVAVPGLVIGNAEAKWIVRVVRAVPTIPPYTARVAARSYMAAEQRGARQTAALDAFLAYAPWDSEAKLTAYETAVAEGHVPGAPALLGMVRVERAKAEPSERKTTRRRKKGAKS